MAPNLPVGLPGLRCPNLQAGGVAVFAASVLSGVPVRLRNVMMLAQRAIIFRLLLKMTVGRNQNDDHVFLEGPAPDVLWHDTGPVVTLRPRMRTYSPTGSPWTGIADRNMLTSSKLPSDAW